MIFGLHGVMKHPHDMDRLPGNVIEDIVLIDFELPIASPDIVAGNTNKGFILYGFHTRFVFTKVLVCLINTKILIGVKPDVFQVLSRFYLLMNFIHRLGQARFLPGLLPDSVHVQHTCVTAFFALDQGLA